MSYRSYVKIGRRAEFEGRYTSRVNPADASGGGGGTGADGRPGKDGKDGKDGEGVPTGGDAGQVLAKIDGADFNTEWVDGGDLTGYATEDYVDSAVENIDLSEYATEGYVDNAVKNIDLSDYATVTYSDIKDDNLQNQIDELSVSRGKVARYTVKNIDGTPVSRPGEMSSNNPFWSNVVAISFGIEDLDGTLTKPINTDDIIEFVDVETDKVSRYRVTDAAGAPTAVGVEYVSGNADFAPDQEKQVYIYPQNGAGASKEYVDEQGLALKGYIDHFVGETNDKVDEEILGLKDYIDTEIDSLPDNDPVPVDDFMTLTGTQLVTPGTWRIQQNTSSRGLFSYISILDDQLNLYHVADPTSAEHAANKQYVDQLAGPKPAQFSWLYDGTKSSSSAPADGKFYKNDDYLRFSFKTYNGVDLSNGVCDDTGAVVTEYGPVGTIWYYDETNKNWKMKRQFRTDSWRWNYNNHFEFKLSSSKGHAWSTLTTGVNYYITIGGWF